MSLSKLEAELLKVLKAAESVMVMCYDSSEDNNGNPIMRDIGNALQQAQKAIAKAEKPTGRPKAGRKR